MRTSLAAGVATLALLAAVACGNQGGAGDAPGADAPAGSAGEPTAAAPSPQASGQGQEASPDGRETAPAQAADDPVAPELAFTAATLDGGTFDGSAYQGRDVVLWMWAPW